MIQHAWTVLCDKTITDKATNNVSLDVIEEVRFSLPKPPEDAKGIVVPYPMEVVSLWYREHSQTPEQGRARLTLLGPDKSPLGEAQIVVDLTKHVRLRAVTKFPALPAPASVLTGGGRFLFVLEAEQSPSQWREVARVPLEVKVEIVAEQAVVAK